MENWKYTAFISYRHGGTDEFVAKTIHTMLESYRVPGKLASRIGKKKVGRIFRDVDELPSSSSLYQNIEEALGQSEFLIVICTPRLQESQWCMREIELFKKMRGSDHIIAVLAEGEPQESFPYEITHRLVNGQEIEVEPLAADVRGETPAKQKKKMKIEKLRILAAMLHCEFDQLRQRDRQRRIHKIAAAGGVTFAVICAFFAQTMRENIRLAHQVRKTQSAQSYLLAEYSDTALSADNPKLAAMLAMEGLPENLGDDRPFEGAAMASLTNALQMYDYQKGYVAKYSVPTHTMDAVMVSPYGDYIAYIDLVSSTEYTLHFYDIEKGETVADFPVDPDYNNYRSCNSKVAFFGDHRCAIAGKDGIQVIDLNTMSVLWEGAKCMTVSASKDDSVVSAYDCEEEKLTFYTADGELLSEQQWDSSYTVYYGISDDGVYAAMVELSDEGETEALDVLDTHTGEIVYTLKDQNYANLFFGDGSWCKEKLLFRVNDKYGYLDMAGDKKAHMTDTKIDAEICYLDAEKELAYYRDGSDLNCISVADGKIQKTYECSKNIQDADYIGEPQKDTFAVYCEDGSVEYVDFTEEEPYRIGRLEGDGTNCSEISAGGKYMAACLYNNYEFRIYQLNDRSSERKAELKKSPAEQIVTIVHTGELFCINGSRNSYSIHLNTMKGAEFDALSSYMHVVNEHILSCDNLDGTISFYDAETGELLCNLPDGVGDNEYETAAYMIDGNTLKKYDYTKTDAAAEDVEPVSTEQIPEGCTTAYLTQNNYLILEQKGEEGQAETLLIQDPDRKEIFSQKVTDMRGTAEKDYIIYQAEGSQTYTVYNFVKDQKLAELDLGEFDWNDFVNGGYLFLCSSDKGAFILDENTGEMILKIPDASTLYVFDAPEGQPYFTALYLSDNGETRLDVYDKNELSSPIAKIEGGIGINENGEVLIYDGMETVYAVPFLSMRETYDQGIAFLGGQTLTSEQRIQYHCD